MLRACTGQQVGTDATAAAPLRPAGSVLRCEYSGITATPAQVLAPNFPQIDSDIDAREYSFDEGENSTDFKGFHRLERLLFRCALPQATSASGQMQSIKGAAEQSPMLCSASAG